MIIVIIMISITVIGLSRVFIRIVIHDYSDYHDYHDYHWFVKSCHHDGDITLVREACLRQNG